MVDVQRLKAEIPVEVPEIVEVCALQTVEVSLNQRPEEGELVIGLL